MYIHVHCIWALARGTKQKLIYKNAFFCFFLLLFIIILMTGEEKIVCLIAHFYLCMYVFCKGEFFIEGKVRIYKGRRISCVLINTAQSKLYYLLVFLTTKLSFYESVCLSVGFFLCISLFFSPQTTTHDSPFFLFVSLRVLVPIKCP